MINFVSLALLVTLAGILMLAVFKYSQVRTSELLYFIFLIISVITWGTFLYLFINKIEVARLTHVYGKFVWISSLLALANILLFARSYPTAVRDDQLLTKLGQKNIILTLAVIFSAVILLVDNLIGLSDIESTSIKFGPQSFILLIYMFFLILEVIYTFRRQLERHNGIQRLRVRYLAMGLGSSLVLAFSVNGILPVIISSSRFSLIGFSFAAFGVFSIAYTIFRYQLLDIRFLLGKFIYYTLQSALIYVAFYFFISFYNSLFQSVFSTESLLLGIPISYGFVFVFHAFNTAVKNYTDTRLISPDYNPFEELDAFNQKLNALLDLHDIARSTTSLISKTIRPSSTSLAVVNNDNDWSMLPNEKDSVINKKDLRFISAIFTQENRDPIILEDEMLINQPLEHSPNTRSELIKIMNKGDIKFIAPIYQESKVSGLLFLGSKDANSPFNQVEIDFLDSISSNLSLAINRSLLYQETQQFNVELQRKVEQATSELKVKNTSLEDALTKLEEIRRQERDMIDVMGHELRTPISIVRNALLVLDSKFKKNDGEIPKDLLAKYLEMAIESVKRELTLIETLLSATKVEGNRIQLQFTKVDLKDVVDDALEALRRDAKQKGLTVNYDPPSEDIFVYADRVRIQEVMDNFLSNAIKYTPRGSIDITLRVNDGMGWVAVKDSGVGISEQDLKKLGRKFFRAQPHYSANDGARPSGTGLGLYVTFELIDVMEGIRDIKSEIGKGSTFSFGIPVFDGQEDRQIDQTFMTNPALAKETIDDVTGKTIDRTEHQDEDLEEVNEPEEA